MPASSDAAPQAVSVQPASRYGHLALRKSAAVVRKWLDFLDYAHHRCLLRLQFRLRQMQHRWVLQGQPRRILVVRLASIGDVARSTAVVVRLREKYPDAIIDYLTTVPALPLIRSHPAVTSVYTLEDLEALGEYDWIVNLQTKDPPDMFLASTGHTYQEVLRHLSLNVRAKLRSGRRLVAGRDTEAANIVYCRSEMEELFTNALLSCDPRQYPATSIHLDSGTHAEALRRFSFPHDPPLLGLFLGSNSIGCGADEGYRTYSIEYLEQLIRQFAGRFTIVVLGQSSMRNADERARYRVLLDRYPEVIDLVDRTSLDELVAVVGQLKILISTDSSPVHIALAQGVPVVGLYVCDASFRMGPQRVQPSFVAIDSRPPCFYYSWRWRFFCGLCRDARTRASYCQEPVAAFAVDRIPVSDVEGAADLLLRNTSDVRNQRTGPQTGRAHA